MIHSQKSFDVELETLNGWLRKCIVFMGLGGDMITITEHKVSQDLHMNVVRRQSDCRRNNGFQFPGV